MAPVCYGPRLVAPSFPLSRNNLVRVSATAAGTPPDEEEDKQVVRKVAAAGSGFGAYTKAATSSSSSKASSKNAASSSDRVTRRAAPNKPLIVPQSDTPAQQLEGIVVYGLLTLLIVILVEGLALAASGFLPEEWDKFFVEVIYPSFTPTVGVFTASAAAYGLVKFLKNESQNKS